MKKTKKHNIKNISFLALTFSALCLAGCNAVESSNSKVVEEMPQAYIMQHKAVMRKKAYGDTLDLETITDENWIAAYEDLTGEQLEDITENPDLDIAVTGSYNTHTIVNIKLKYTSYQEDVVIKRFTFNFETANPSDNNGTMTKSITMRGTNAPTVNAGFSVNGSALTITSAELTQYPESVYYAFTQEEPPAPSMGEQIVDGIESGLGMIGTLATEFLAGFGALFYVNNQLTPFAIFSLVFLGIAITFAIIKLCLNVVRSNTGA